MGVDNVVPMNLRTYAHRKVKEEVEAENLRLRASGVVGAGGGANDAGVLPYQKVKGDGKAEGKGGRGRGDRGQRQLQGGDAAGST